jgi:hypothetical protein
VSRREEIIDWQRRYRECTEVWGVHSHGDTTGQMYESREAAEVEASWRRARGDKRARVVHLGHVQTLPLARERWVSRGGER